MIPFPLDYLQFSDYPLTRPTLITLGAWLASYSRDYLQPDGKKSVSFPSGCDNPLPVITLGAWLDTYSCVYLHLVATSPCL